MIPIVAGVTPGVLPVAPTAGSRDRAAARPARPAAGIRLDDLGKGQLQLGQRLPKRADRRLAELLLGDGNQRAQDLHGVRAWARSATSWPLGPEAHPDARGISEGRHRLDDQVADRRPPRW